LFVSSSNEGTAAASPHPSSVTLHPFTRWHWILYVSLGLGFLAKGPIAWLVPGLALLLYRFAFWRKPVPWRSLKVWPGALIMLAITGAWGIPALIETQGLFWKVGMGEHVIDRGTSSFNGRFPIPGYYLFTSLLSLFPWIALLPQVWRKVRANWTPQAAFLVSWLAAPYLIFSFYATQLPHYVMPAFPAAMLLLAAWGPANDAPKWMRRWTYAVLGLFLLAGLVLKVVGSIGGFPAPLGTMIKDLGSLLTILALAMPLSGMVIMSLLPSVEKTDQPYSRGGAIGVALLMLVGVPFSLFMATRDLNKTQPAAQLAAQIGPLPDKTEYLGWQFQEPSLVFHFNHHWKFLNKLDTIKERLDRKGPRVCVLLRREWTMSKAIDEKRAGKAELSTAQDFSKEVDAVIAAHPDYQVIEFTGLNAARASWTELRVLVRK
jgi:4-amino-4-deoxy-L-arabinose transferase-like glycosyltransferase